MKRWPQIILMFWIAAALAGPVLALQPNTIDLGRILAPPDLNADAGLPL